MDFSYCTTVLNKNLEKSTCSCFAVVLFGYNNNHWVPTLCIINLAVHSKFGLVLTACFCILTVIFPLFEYQSCCIIVFLPAWDSAWVIAPRI
jgi:hypothetical protein